MAWIITGAILLIIVLLLISPLKIYVNYDNEKADIYFKYLFFKRKYKSNSVNEKKSRKVNKKKSDKKKNSENAKKNEKSGKKKKIMPEKTEDRIEFIASLAESGGKALRFGLRRICIYNIVVDFIISDLDAYDCAIKFGKTNIVVYNLLSYLNCFVKLKKKSIDIKCVYNQPECVYRFNFIAKISPAAGIFSAIIFIFTFLVNNKKKENIKTQTLNESEEK